MTDREKTTDWREPAARWHDEIAGGLRCAAEKIRSEWCGADMNETDRRANFADARDHDKRAAFHADCAAALRASLNADKSGSRTDG